MKLLVILLPKSDHCDQNAMSEESNIFGIRVKFYAGWAFQTSPIKILFWIRKPNVNRAAHYFGFSNRNYVHMHMVSVGQSGQNDTNGQYG